MKALFTAALAALVSVSASAATINPTTNPEKAPMKAVVYPGASANKLNVNVEKSAGSSASISVIDADGRALAVQHLPKKATTVQAKFDLSELADGDYKVVISDGTHKEVKSLSVKSPEVAPARVLALN